MFVVQIGWKNRDGSITEWEDKAWCTSEKECDSYIQYDLERHDFYDGVAELRYVKKSNLKSTIKNNNMNRSYPNAPYRGQNNNRGFNNGFQNNQNKPVKKKSGCSMKRYFPKSGVNKSVEQTIVNGWKKLYKGSLLVFTAVTTSKSKLSDKGWYGSVAVTVLDKGSMQKQFYWATMEKSTGKVVIKDLGLVMNPKGGKGGVVAEYGRR